MSSSLIKTTGATPIKNIKLIVQYKLGDICSSGYFYVYNYLRISLADDSCSVDSLQLFIVALLILFSWLYISCSSVCYDCSVDSLKLVIVAMFILFSWLWYSVDSLRLVIVGLVAVLIPFSWLWLHC